MSEIHLWKTPAGVLAPCSEADQEKLKRFKTGVMVRAEVKQMRNYLFFRKWWALITFAFDQWSDTDEMPTYKGQRIQPVIDRFRKDVTILAGYCHPVADVNGGVHLEADSISFANMTDETFAELYNKTIDVVLQKILKGRGYTEEQLRELVDQTMAFI